MHHSDFSDVNCPPYTELVWCKCLCSVIMRFRKSMGLQVQESLPADWTLLVRCLPCYGYSCLLHTTSRMDITH